MGIMKFTERLGIMETATEKLTPDEITKLQDKIEENDEFKSTVSNINDLINEMIEKLEESNPEFNFENPLHMDAIAYVLRRNLSV